MYQPRPNQLLPLLGLAWHLRLGLKRKLPTSHQDAEPERFMVQHSFMIFASISESSFYNPFRDQSKHPTGCNRWGASRGQWGRWGR